MKLKKLLVLGLALACIATISITATLAYFTDSTEAVTNTFTVGKVEITLDEAPVGEDGQKTDGNRVQANEYRLYPGKDYDKDPTVHVGDESEDCYVFIYVKNDLEEIIVAGEVEDENGDKTTIETIENQMAANGWIALGDTYPGYYYYQNPENGSQVVAADTDLVVFEQFVIDPTLEADDLDDYATEKDDEGNVTGGKWIEVMAYAIQAENIADAPTAWGLYYTQHQDDFTAANP